MFRDITRADVVTRRYATYETTTHMLLGHYMGRAQMHMRVKKTNGVEERKDFEE